MKVYQLAGLGILFCMIFQACSNTDPQQATSSLDMEKVAVFSKDTTHSLQEEITRVAYINRDLSSRTMPAEETPEGMIFVPGGFTEVGSVNGLPREQPVLGTKLKGFFMDKSPVTVGDFREFTEATGYTTQAEKFGDAAIFNMDMRNWELKPGAYWAYPLGPDFEPAASNHPVTQVSFNDVLAYCEWAGKRLPTEAEWEHAARNGRNSRNKYSWGESIQVNGEYKANIWNGVFPAYNTGDDGYLFTCPVGTFGENELGLTDMAGNVWEWCSDWYLPYGQDQDSYAPDQESEKVMRGGSFMCDPNYCHGYRVSGRSGSTPETGLFHVGFRCVMDIE